MTIRPLRPPLCASTWLVAWLLGAPSAAAADFFAIRNENPLLRGFYLPLPVDLAAARPAWSAAVSVTNTLNVESRGGEDLFVDGESTTLRLMRDGAAGTLRYRVVLPVYMDSGGRLDSTISRWHRLFGLPQGLRPDVPENQFRYAYSRAGAGAVSREHAAIGLGDLALELGWSPAATGSWAFGFWGGIEAPTGGAHAWMGSGGWDGALWLSSAWRGELWRFAAEGGAVRPCSDRLFAGDAERVSFFGRTAATRLLGERWSIRAQLEAGSSKLHGTELRFLGPSLQIALGLAHRSAGGSVIEGGFVEDAAANTAPDVSFFLAWRQR